MRPVLVGALLAGWAAAPVAAASAPAWSIVPSPNSAPTPTRNVLLGTTCVAANDCWSVGYWHVAVSTTQTLTQHWDGSAWSVVPSPSTSATQGNVLRGVACASASDCWAVGSFDDGGSQKTLALHWDGATWSRVTTPSAAGSNYSYLLGVSCVASNDCTAVGYASGSTHQTLIERWNGSAWSVVASPNTSTSQPNILEDVTCVSATDCFAVGYAVDAITGLERTLVERFNGSTWVIANSPNALVSTDNHLRGVACASAADCWAVGSASNGSALQTLAVRWNGSAWSVVTSPNAAAGAASVFHDVACASASECWAAGASGDDAATLVARWNGTAWAAVAAPSPGAPGNTLRGVACAGGACGAVGWHDAGGLSQTLVLRASGGAWAQVASANETTSQNNTLLGVTCVAAADCWAVASYYDGSVQQTLIERWNGAAWSLVPSPNAGSGRSNILYDVKCTGLADCWAIGYFADASAWQPLALRWNGASWSQVTAPSTSTTQDHFLTSLHCRAAADCWAVGYFNNGSAYQTLALRWNGSAWSAVATPNHDAFNQHRFNGVSCTAADDCWAVGHYFDGLRILTLAAHWDGAAWSLVPTPATATSENYLNSIACVATDDCWAVGRSVASNLQQTLIEHWDGVAWSMVPSPNTDAARPNYLNRVACASADACWAVGAHFVDGHFQTLAQRWDGSEWTIRETANSAPTQNNVLVGVACPTALECWAVGQYVEDAGAFQTLVQHYVEAAPPAGPSAFGFVTRSDVATNAYVTSEAVTLAGFAGTLPLTIDNGGQYRINGGSFTSAAGQVSAGDALVVRHVSADAPGTAKLSTVTVGATTAGFRTVTSALDRTPAAFTFGAKNGVAPGAPVESEAIVLQDFNTAIAIAAGPGAEYRVDGGAWTRASGTLQPGQALQLRHVATTQALGYTKTYLKVGGVTGYFTTRTQ